MIHEHIMCVGYECTECGGTFEFPFNAYSHHCSKWHRENRIAAQKQMAQIQLHTFKADGSHAGIALSEPQELVIARELGDLRQEIKQLVGRW